MLLTSRSARTHFPTSAAPDVSTRLPHSDRIASSITSISLLPHARKLTYSASSLGPASSRRNVFRMGSQAYEIALSLALRSIGSAAFPAIARNGDQLLEPFARGAFVSKARPQSRKLGGSITPDHYYERNVVVPVRYSKRFFYVPMGLYRGRSRNARARGTPLRSARGGPWGARSAASASRVTSAP